MPYLKRISAEQRHAFFFIVEIALHTFVINYPVFVLEIYTYGVLYAIGNVQKTVQRLYLVEP